MTFPIHPAARCFFLLALPLVIVASPTFAQTTMLSADAAYKTALYTWSGGNQIKAEALLDEYASRYPANEKLSLFRAACIRSRSDVDKADGLFRDIVQRARRTGKDASKFSPQAQCALLMTALDMQRQPEVSFGLLENLAAHNAKDPIPTWLLAMADRTYGRKTKAVAAYRRLIRTAPPGSPQVHQVYANLMDEMGRHGEALASRQKAAWMEPTSTNRNSLGNTLFALQRYDEAITVYQKTTQNYPNDPLAWNALGKALIERERYPEAAEALSKADALDSGDPNTLYYWGLSLEKQKNYPDALAKYKASLETKPNVRRTMIHMANVLEQLGFGRDAQKYRDQAGVKTP